MSLRVSKAGHVSDVGEWMSVVGIFVKSTVIQNVYFINLYHVPAWFIACSFQQQGF